MLLAADGAKSLILLLSKHTEGGGCVSDEFRRSCLWIAACGGHISVVEVGPGGRREASGHVSAEIVHSKCCSDCRLLTATHTATHIVTHTATRPQVAVCSTPRK